MTDDDRKAIATNDWGYLFLNVNALDWWSHEIVPIHNSWGHDPGAGWGDMLPAVLRDAGVPTNVLQTAGARLVSTLDDQLWREQMEKARTDLQKGLSNYWLSSRLQPSEASP